MNVKTRFLLKFALSILLAIVAASFISYNFASFGLVFLVLAYALCPVRAIKPQPRNRRHG